MCGRTARRGADGGTERGARGLAADGRGVAAALESRGHDVVRLVWDGRAGRRRALRAAPVDVVFLALHGRGGEDGCVQGMLELMGVPYTGSGVLASALAMDKLKAKEMFRLHNVPTPPYYVATRADLDDLEEVHGSFGFPAIVKPRREGSSVGLAKAATWPSWRRRSSARSRSTSTCSSSASCKATEVHVGILDGRVLGAIEVVPRDGLYDYRAKYTAGMTEYIAPPRLPSTRLRGVMNLAERAARALSCTGACRVDLLVTEGENEYVLEVNTLPGNDADVAPAEDRRRGGHRLPRALRGDPRGRAPARGPPHDEERSTASQRRAPQRSQVEMVDGDEESVPLKRRAAG